MSSTPNKEEKIKDLIKNWDIYKKMSQEDVGEKLGVCGKTIYDWRRKLARRGIVLVPELAGKTDKDIFDNIAKK